MTRVRARLAASVLGLLVLLAVAADPVRAAIAQRLDAPAVADAATVVAQREAAERALARGYVKGVEQLRSTGNVRLPVSAAQAQAIQQRAVADLRRVRQAALADLAAASGLTGAAAAAYVSSTDPRLETAPPDAGATLLAPAFFAVVARADGLFAQVADQATRELTTAPSPSPSPSR